MARKLRHTPGQVISKLREAVVNLAKGPGRRDHEP
jgi:hypothetical protein